MDALKKINWKQPKYMIPLIIYFPLLFVGYFVIDLFHTEKAEIPDGLATTEYLNPDLPEAKMKGDGIGNKYESMLKSYGKIDDYSALGNIERNEEETREEYESKYTDEEREQLEAQEAAKLAEMQRPLQESAQKGQEIAQGGSSSSVFFLSEASTFPSLCPASAVSVAAGIMDCCAWSLACAIARLSSSMASCSRCLLRAMRSSSDGEPPWAIS